MQECNFLTFGKVCTLSTQRLHNTTGYGVVATNGNWAGANLVNFGIEVGNALNAGFIVIGLGKRHISNVANLKGFPRINLKLAMKSTQNR